MDVKEGQCPQSFSAEVTSQVSTNYLFYLPEGYEDSEEAWPLVLFLHGKGERGDDLDLVAIHGPPKRVAAGASFPFILVSPQCPDDDWWTSVEQITTLTALLDDVTSRYRVDLDRVYLTGLSMGGFGTFALATATPKRFAAIAPVCGGGEPFAAEVMAHIPAWVFHGAKDDVVPLKRSQEMVDALEAAGADVKFTIYPEAKHDSWTETYDNPDLYEWLLKQRRK